MNGIIFVEGNWENKIIEWKFNVKKILNVWYGMIVFGKFKDG